MLGDFDVMLAALGNDASTICDFVDTRDAAVNIIDCKVLTFAQELQYRLVQFETFVQVAILVEERWLCKVMKMLILGPLLL